MINFSSTLFLLGFFIYVRHLDVAYICQVCAANLKYSTEKVAFVMRCTICYHLHNLKNVKNTHGGVLLLVKFQPITLWKVTLLHGYFSLQMAPNRVKHHIVTNVNIVIWWNVNRHARIEMFFVNKHGLLKIVSISSSRHLFLWIYLGRIFSCNETPEGRRHTYT